MWGEGKRLLAVLAGSGQSTCNTVDHETILARCRRLRERTLLLALIIPTVLASLAVCCELLADAQVSTEIMLLRMLAHHSAVLYECSGGGHSQEADISLFVFHFRRCAAVPSPTPHHTMPPVYDTMHLNGLLWRNRHHRSFVGRWKLSTP